jgi:hypothetical protein
MSTRQIRTDQIRSDQIRSDQIRTDQNRSDQIRSDQNRSDISGCGCLLHCARLACPSVFVCHSRLQNPTTTIVTPYKKSYDSTSQLRPPELSTQDWSLSWITTRSGLSKRNGYGLFMHASKQADYPPKLKDKINHILICALCVDCMPCILAKVMLCMPSPFMAIVPKLQLCLLVLNKNTLPSSPISLLLI